MINLAAVLDGLEKAKNLPWKGMLFVISGSFLIASIATVFLSRALLPASITDFKDVELPSEVILAPVKPSLTNQELDVILKRNLFNREGKYGDDDDAGKKGKQMVVGKDPIKSNLPLKLIGTIYSGDPKSGIALIEESSKQSTNSFFVGDTVAEGAILYEILREKIILDLGDHREYLELEPKLPPHRRRRTEGTGSLISGQKKSRYATEPPPDRFKEEGFERNGSNMVLSSEYRKKILGGDFAKVLQDAKAEPYMNGKELAGFRLTHIKEDSIYQKAGLQDGDVIREINGVSLVNTAQTIKLLNSLRGENEIEIRIERGGATINMNIQVR